MTFEMNDSKIEFFCSDMPPMTLSFRKCRYLQEVGMIQISTDYDSGMAFG
jgi:hypothetical protein